MNTNMCAQLLALACIVFRNIQERTTTSSPKGLQRGKPTKY